MAQYIDKYALVAEIEKRLDELWDLLPNASDVVNDNYTKEEASITGKYAALESFSKFIDTLEVKDPYEQCVQYDSIKAGIQAHAETYSFNIESELFNQLTKEQQKLWRKEIEQACISGSEMGIELARDTRYKDTLEVKEVDLEEVLKEYFKGWEVNEDLGLVKPDGWSCIVKDLYIVAKHFFKLGLKAQKGE